MSVHEKNVKALVARPFLGRGFQYRNIKGINPDFVKLRNEYPYSGPVLAQVPGCDPFYMYNDADDNVAYTFFYYGEGSYESLSLITFALLARGLRHVFDVGGHTGVFTLSAIISNPAAQGHYFEVMPQIADRASINFEISGIRNRVSVNNQGVSKKAGKMTVHAKSDQALWTGASLEALSERTTLSTATKQTVPVISLDEYWQEAGSPQVGLVKLDVENHELAVFEGAQQMLSTCQPFVLCEVLSKAQFEDFIAALVPMGYEYFYEIDDNNLALHGVSADMKYRNGEDYDFRQYHNVLCCPRKLDVTFAETLYGIVAHSKLGKSKLFNFS